MNLMFAEDSAFITWLSKVITISRTFIRGAISNLLVCGIVMSKTLVVRKSLDKKTRQHLLEAMHGEAFAFVKYMLFSEAAKKNGHAKLAELFEKTAKVERFEHFAEEAELLGLVSSESKNLSDAIEGESYEVTTMYKEFAEEAKTCGDLAAAERFSEIRKDEMSHLAAYKAALESI